MLLMPLSFRAVGESDSSEYVRKEDVEEDM